MEKNNRIVLQSEIERFLVNLFSFRLGPAYEVVSDYRDKENRKQDIAILYNREVIAFIECKRIAQDFVESFRVRQWLDPLFKNHEAKYYFVADKSECYLFRPDDYASQKLTLSDAIAILVSAREEVLDPPSLKDVQSILKDIAREHKLLEKIRPFADGLKVDEVEKDSVSSTFSFSIDKEDDLFLILLERVTGSKLCRYTTIDSLFELFKNEKQNMCNIVCMNDRGEYSYADNYVFGRYPQIGTKDFNELDNCFILSLLDKTQEENLTMWRLYGNDAKGACITYEAGRMIMGGKYNQFFLARVSYGQKNNKHPKLEYIKALINALNIRGWSFTLRRWNIWKHFFKSYLFAVEKEVRLMYYDAPISRSKKEDYKWIKNPESQIVSKMQLFDFKAFPMKVEYAKVGPNCQEASLLARQFETMAKSTSSLQKVLVDYSRIEDYR